jgi:hypothetical protein
MKGAGEMRTLTMLCALLFVTAAYAATATYDFEQDWPLPPDMPPCTFPGTLSNGGISARFGTGWALYRRSPEPTGWPVSVSGHHADALWKDGPAGGSWAVKFTSLCGVDWTSQDARSITFNPPIKFFACDLIGDLAPGDTWMFYPYVVSCDNGATWNVHCSGGTINGAGLLKTGNKFQMVTESYAVKASVQPALTQGWTGCGPEYPSHPDPCCTETFNWSNTDAPLCNWQHIEMYSPVAVSRVYCNFYPDGLYGHLIIDNVQVSTAQCMNPPCQFERASEAHDEGPIEPAVNPGAPDHGAAIVMNTVTGERMTLEQFARRAHPDGRMYVTPTGKTTWGALKLLYH